ncbi:MAG: DMT family transporter [Rhizobiaceae bacterium]
MINFSSPRLTPTTWAWLILLSIIWGGSFLLGRIAVQEVPPLTLVLARVSLAAIALSLLLLWRKGDFQHTWKLWGAFAVMGTLNNIIPFALIFYGQKEIGAGLAAIINAMTPIWTVIIAHLATNDERLSLNKIIGMSLGFLGVAILIGSDAVAGLSASVISQTLVIGATISYGFAAVYGRRFANIPPIETARGQLTMSTLIMIPVALFIDIPWTLPMPSSAAIWSVIILALVCSAYAYILFFRILSRAGAVNVSLVTLLVPVSAVILGILVIGETLTFRQLLGMAIIMAGLIVIDGRLLKNIRS